MNSNSTKPLIICLTATRNYGWITKAFLKANSLWADYIIIADQHSTDSTREIANSFPNVILVDVDNLEYGEALRCEMVINRARQIEGDKILFYLAIDEILTADYFNTSDWEKILKSKPGDVYFFQWANITPSAKHYWLSTHEKGDPFFMARLFHDDGITPYDSEGLDMHTHCIPYPKDDSNRTYYVNDFKLLHFGDFYLDWNNAKQRFYQFVDFNKNKRTVTVLSRMYNRVSNRKTIVEIPDSWIYCKSVHGFDLFSEIDTNVKPFFDSYVLDFISKNGIDKYKFLHVWDEKFLATYDIKDPRNFKTKIIHFYFNFTMSYTKTILVRGIDKILKKLHF
jgi:hypothetical protein